MDEQQQEARADEDQRETGAEGALAELRVEHERLTRQLHEATAQLAATERRGRIDQLLIEADAVDLEAARVLTEHVIAQMDDGDVAEVVADLRRHKPYLFRQSHEGASGGQAAGGSMSARVRAGDEAEAAAAEAVATGNRRDLLRYLRMRRGRGRV